MYFVLRLNIGFFVLRLNMVEGSSLPPSHSLVSRNSDCDDWFYECVVLS